jgi:hypothetical protein
LEVVDLEVIDLRVDNLGAMNLEVVDQERWKLRLHSLFDEQLWECRELSKTRSAES